MAESTEGRDPESGGQAVAPGGRSSRGPNPDPSGSTEPGGLVPPYDGRTSGAGETPSAEARAESVERQLDGTSPSDAGRDAETMKDDEMTDTTPTSTPGVRRGEDAGGASAEPGREDLGREGPAQRPVGTSDERDSTGVDPQETITDSPTQPAGDQGG